MQFPKSQLQEVGSDGNPELLRIKADNTNKRNVVCFWLLFVLIVIISIIISFAGPDEVIYKTNQTELRDAGNTKCNPCGFSNGILYCKQFTSENPKLGLMMRDLSILNQNAIIRLILLQHNQKLSEQELSLTLYSLQIVQNDIQRKFQKSKQISTQKILFEPHAQQLFQSGLQSNQNIGFYRHLKLSNYLLVVQFENIDGMISPGFPYLQAQLVNPSFTIFILVVRFVFFSITFITTIIYLYQLKKINKLQITTQQKLTTTLSLGILFFNDPFYSLTVLYPTIFGTILSSLFIVQFVILIVFYWVIHLQKIYSQEGQIHCTISKGKKFIFIIYFLVFFCLFGAFYSSIAVYQLEDNFMIPPYKISPPLFALTIICLVVVFFYILRLYVLILWRHKNILWRTNVWMGFTCYFILVLFISLVIESIGLYGIWSTKILIFLFAMNLYTIYMQYMFTPALQTEMQKNKFKHIQESLKVVEGSEVFSDSVLIDMNSKLEE